jgi:hypothetical protein
MPIPQQVILGGLFEAYIIPALWKIFKNDDILKELVTGGFHDLLAGTHTGAAVKMPYVVVGETTEIPVDRLTSVASVVFITLEIHSSYQGRLEIVRIADRLKLRLHRQERALDAAPWHVCMSVVDSFEVIGDQDNRMIGYMRLKIEGQPLR